MRKTRQKVTLWIILLLAAGLLAACSGAAGGTSSSGADDGKPRVITSTTIVGDVVSQVGGDLIDQTTLMQPGQNPHSYEPTAQQIAGVENADVIFVSGLGLEEGLINTLDAAGGDTPLVALSDNVDLLESPGSEDTHDGEDEHGAYDPHTWLNPLNVIVWTNNIADTLSEVDPANADAYRANADAYIAELQDLDATIMEQVQTIPPEKRKLVTNHEAFDYFTQHYGFEQIGTVYLDMSGTSEPNAGDLAALIDTIHQQNVTAIFVETTVSSQMAQVVAEEAGQDIEVYTLYTGSLSEPGGEADSYINLMRANIKTIVEALGS